MFVVDERDQASDLLGQNAAALAATAVVFKTSDKGYSQQCINHAKRLYSMGKANEGLYISSVPDAANFYKTAHWMDHMAYAAAWLFYATGDQTYLNEAQTFYSRHFQEENGAKDLKFSWFNAWPGAAVLLASLTQQDNYVRDAEGILLTWNTGGKGIVYTPKGLAYSANFGSLRYTANIAFLAAVYSKHISNTNKKTYYQCFARKQLRYMLGDSGRSYVVGVGSNPPCQVHSRSASCPPAGVGSCSWSNYVSPGCNVHTLYGALVGGPDHTDKYTDIRSNYVQNEVTLDYNAGFTGALAGMIEAQAKWADCRELSYGQSSQAGDIGIMSDGGYWSTKRNSAAAAAGGVPVLLALALALLQLVLQLR